MSNSRILQIHRETASLKERYAALHHCMEVEENADTAFIKDRSNAVDALLAGWMPTNSTANREPSKDDIEIEFPCAGLYESCRDFEITEEMLQQLKVTKKPPETQTKQTDLPQHRAFEIQQQKPFETQQHKSFEAQQQKPFEMPQSSGIKKVFNVFAKKVNERGLASTQESSWVNNQPSQSVGSQEQREHRNEEPSKPKAIADFRTAREELIIQANKKNPSSSATGTNRYGQSTTSSNSGNLFNYGNVKKSLGARRTVRSGFVPPIARPPVEEEPKPMIPISSTPPETSGASLALEDKRLSNIDPKMVELITNEIMHNNTQIDWSEIAGLEYAKSIIKEAVVYPLLRPDIFTGLRRPPRGILLFGPPGTGKTLIGKCIASQSKSTFFTISASSLTSKWVGESEKMVRALFAVAAVKQPSVVFIDEIDSLLCQRSETEHESSRRLKTEFLVQLDGAATSDDDRILIIGATNRPQELDEAARRRFVKRLYIPLPEKPARIEILQNLLQKVNNNLSGSEVERISEKTDGFSGADMSSLCREASMEPIRSIPAAEIPFIDVNNVRPVNGSDFESALQNVRPSVSQMDLQQYTDWNRIYGSLQ